MSKKEEKLSQEELLRLSKEFPDGNAPLAIRTQVTEFQKARKESQKRQAVTKTKSGKLKQISKTDLFLEEFLRNGGNATQAALVVFNCSSIESAANIGSQYLKKAKSMARLHLEKKGYGYGKMLDVAADKMENSKNPEWWDRLMKLAGYEDFMDTGKKNVTPVSVNVFQAHKALSSEYVDGEIAEVVDGDVPQNED